MGKKTRVANPQEGLPLSTEAVDEEDIVMPEVTCG